MSLQIHGLKIIIFILLGVHWGAGLQCGTKKNGSSELEIESTGIFISQQRVGTGQVKSQIPKNYCCDVDFAN